MNEQTLVKREWVYVQRPQVYGLSPCECGNDDPDWSEYQKHLWCAKCEKDFIPEDSGILDGTPVGVQTAALMGIYFDRIVLTEPERYERFSMEKLDWEPVALDSL